MATLNANPIVYKPSAITREASSNDQQQPNSFFNQLDKTLIESDSLNPLSLQTLTNVTMIHPSQLTAKTNNSINSIFSIPEFSSNYRNDSDINNNDDIECDEWDTLEIFDLLRTINDPEHPLTLEELKVCQLELITLNNEKSEINLNFTPTIPHCSMATLIGLCIRVKLIRSLPARFKIKIEITPGSHSTEEQINKQLNDKERVAAALENNHLLEIVNKCLEKKNASAIITG